VVKEKIVFTRTIEQKIYLIRGQKVMLDKDLAELYGIETKVLKQAVKEISSDSLQILCLCL